MVAEGYYVVVVIAIIFKIPSCGFSVCAFISIFLFGYSLTAVVESHFFSHRAVKSGVPLGSVLSPIMNVYNKFDLHYRQHALQQAFVNPDDKWPGSTLSPRYPPHHTIRGGLEATVAG